MSIVLVIGLDKPLFIQKGVRGRCPVAFVTGAPNWYWLTVGQGLLSLQQVRVEGGCCYFFCSFTFFHFPFTSLVLSFISSTISSSLFLSFISSFYLFSPFLWETTQNDSQGMMCHLNQTQSVNQFLSKVLIHVFL